MTRVVCGVMDDLRIGKARQEDQTEPEQQGDGGGAQGFASVSCPNGGR
jgi:hypothetical protein